MLERLLREIEHGGTFSPSILAVKLNINESLILAMIDMLVRRGSLKEYPVCQKDACQGCSIRKGCEQGIKLEKHLWVFEGINRTDR